MSTVTLTVRVAGPSDLESVLDVGHRTWPPTYEPIAGPDYVRMGLAKWWTAEATRPALSAGRVLLAEDDGDPVSGTPVRVVGMASYGPMNGRAVLWKLYVLPESQKLGAGGALLRAVVDAVAPTYDELRLAYLDGNEKAAAFYRHHGFNEIEREPGGTGMPDQVWMARALTTEEAR
ncbi:GNAT family N-acetyltransferase [Lapillicoccus jejuensis]|uniref:Acetyltransferase (GNAT) family protein n=1 Tax=Lapillicoccus jejuensis TaxID=402171 RepID=A0A542E3X6_9MICO|nr:GNAT family N-acetyltransferase [Lapillicoccus jejuensis]TQJ09999.1 acetyltransferase (GNAT) family protein [Lapillicoccus jejuensis]